jgi:hypothetical protein
MFNPWLKQWKEATDYGLEEGMAEVMLENLVNPVNPV